MKHLVLGSAGLIGTHLTNYLRLTGEEVKTFDIASNPNEDLRIKPDKNSYLYHLINEVDIVYFLAFDVGGSKYLYQKQSTYDYINNNMLIMQNVFELLQNKKFIFASTQLVKTPCVYGSLKTIGEHYTKSLGGLFVRLWNIYGFEVPSLKSHVVCDFIYQAITTGKIKMLSDGSEEKQFLHAEDCSKWLYQIAKKYDNINRDSALHLSSFQWTKIIELAYSVASFVPGVEIIKGSGYGNVRKTNPDIFAKKYLDTTLIDINEGIGSLITQYKHWIVSQNKGKHE